jgi:hypothetical protein
MEEDRKREERLKLEGMAEAKKMVEEMVEAATKVERRERVISLCPRAAQLASIVFFVVHIEGIWRGRMCL